MARLKDIYINEIVPKLMTKRTDARLEIVFRLQPLVLSVKTSAGKSARLFSPVN